MIHLHLTIEGDLEVDEDEALEEFKSKDPYIVAAGVTGTFNELLSEKNGLGKIFTRAPTALAVPR